MLFGDFTVFWRAGLALLQGQDPYALPGVFYPLPVLALFVPFAALPLAAAQIVWLAIQLVILTLVFRRRAPFVVLFMPALFGLVTGNMVTVWLAFYALLRRGRAPALSLAALCFKPQLVLILGPWLLVHWLRTNRGELVRFAGCLLPMPLFSFLVQPDWVVRWLSVSGPRVSAPISASFWRFFSFLPLPLWIALTAFFSAAVLFWAIRRDDFDLVAIAGMLVNPLTISYDLLLVTLPLRRPLYLVVLVASGLAAFQLAANLVSEAPFLLTTLVLLGLVLRERSERESMQQPVVVPGI